MIFKQTYSMLKNCKKKFTIRESSLVAMLLAKKFISIANTLKQRRIICLKTRSLNDFVYDIE